VELVGKAVRRTQSGMLRDVQIKDSTDSLHFAMANAQMAASWCDEDDELDERRDDEPAATAASQSSAKPSTDEGDAAAKRDAGTVCGYCGEGESGGNLRRCPCGGVWYHTRCQRPDWSRHKAEHRAAVAARA